MTETIKKIRCRLVKSVQHQVIVGFLVDNVMFLLHGSDLRLITKESPLTCEGHKHLKSLENIL